MGTQTLRRSIIFVAVLAGGYLTLAVALRYPVVVVLLLALALTVRRELRASGRRRNRAGYVYIMANGGGRGVKIGRAKNPEQRLKAHRTTAPRARYLKLWRVKDAPAAEARLHSEFRQYRTEGEYFDLPDSKLKHLLTRRLR